jgi:hypothetical protein
MAVVALGAIGAIGLVAFYYLHPRKGGKDPVTDLAEGLRVIAGEEEGPAAERIRELGRFLEEHGEDIDGFAGQVDEKLSKVREVSEDAYLTAKKKIDEYRARRKAEEESEGGND